LVLVLGGYFLADAVGVPISAIAGSGALVLVLVAGRRQKRATLGADPPTVDSQADPRQADHPDVDPRQADPPGVDPSRADPLAVGSRASGPLSGKPREPDTSKVSSHISSVPGSSIDVRRILWEAPWQVVIFSLGMYLVVFGVANAGLTSVVAFALEWLGKQGSTVGALVAGYGAAVLASITNNMPSVLVGALGIHAATQGGNQHAVQHALRHGAHIKQVFIFANVIGNDLGPKITPIGSLATLLWLHVLDRRGVHIGWGQYMKTGIVLVLPVLGVTLLAMAGWLRVLR
jgi:arsenical pump membrane protein